MNIRSTKENDFVCQECGHNSEVHIEVEGMSFNLCFRCWKKLKKQVNRVFVQED